MKWYNNTGETQPIQPRGLGGSSSAPTLAPIQSTLTQNQPSTNTSRWNVDALTNLLTVGTQVAGTVAVQRARSGRAAERQARIAACGRRGLGFLVSRRKREEYRRCVERAKAATSEPQMSSVNKSYSAPSASPRSNTMLIVGIGAVVIIGAVAYFVMRKK